MFPTPISRKKALNIYTATARHWIHVARTGMAHQWREYAVGRPKAVNEEYLERLKELVSHSPRDYGYPFGRWTAQWLSKHLEKVFVVTVVGYYRHFCHVDIPKSA
jgi:transposase